MLRNSGVGFKRPRDGVGRAIFLESGATCQIRGTRFCDDRVGFGAGGGDGG